MAPFPKSLSIFSIASLSAFSLSAEGIFLSSAIIVFLIVISIVQIRCKITKKNPNAQEYMKILSKICIFGKKAVLLQQL
jgi:hypothetical protein